MNQAGFKIFVSPHLFVVVVVVAGVEPGALCLPFMNSTTEELLGLVISL